MLIVLDFDESAAAINGAQAVLARLGDTHSRRALREEYASGAIAFRDYQEREFNSLDATASEITEAALDAIPMRAGLQEFLAAAREGNHRVVIASAGLDLYIRPALAGIGAGDLPLVSVLGQTHPVTGRITGYEYPPAEPHCDRRWATCKCLPMREARENGEAVVFIGDGLMADTCAARHADKVFARSRLLGFCRSEQIDAVEFDGFNVVTTYIRSCGASEGSDGAAS
jgi:2,3-diketo-5-methylthio-1-phosphopentane phosphatase